MVRSNPEFSNCQIAENCKTVKKRKKKDGVHLIIGER